MFLCPPCDEKTEQGLKGGYLNELCDCDIFTRWICSKCHTDEGSFCYDYFEDRTTTERYEDASPVPEWAPATRIIYCHLQIRAVSSFRIYVILLSC